MEKTWTIRVAEEKDVPRMLEIYAPYILETAVSFEYEVPLPAVFRARFDEIAGAFPWIVCETDSGIAGYAYASSAFSRKAYQWDADISVYVDARFHRMGIGTAFYRCIERLLTRMGYRNLYAIVSELNAASIAFHEAKGYRKFAVFEHTGFKFGRWIDTVWLVKVLNPFDDAPAEPCRFDTISTTEVTQLLTESRNH